MPRHGDDDVEAGRPDADRLTARRGRGRGEASRQPRDGFVRPGVVVSDGGRRGAQLAVAAEDAADRDPDDGCRLLHSSVTSLLLSTGTYVDAWARTSWP